MNEQNNISELIKLPAATYFWDNKKFRFSGSIRIAEKFNAYFSKTDNAELDHQRIQFIADAVNGYEADKARIAELEKAVKDLLYIFDRDLPENSIGRRTCDEAKQALETEKGK